MKVFFGSCVRYIFLVLFLIRRSLAIFHFHVNINFHVFAKVLGKRDTIEVRATFAFIDGGDIEENEKHREHSDEAEKANDDRNDFPPSVEFPHGYVRQNHERQHEAENKPEQMRIIINPRQKAEYKQKEKNEKQLSERPPRVQK